MTDLSTDSELDEIIDNFYEDVYSHRRRRVTNAGDRKRVKKEAKTAILAREAKLVRDAEIAARIDELEKFASCKIDHRGEPAPFNPQGLPLSTPYTEEMTRLVNQAAMNRISELHSQQREGEDNG